MIAPGVAQTVQKRTVRTDGHYEGVDYVIQCANCEGWYSVLDATYPLYFHTCTTPPRIIMIKNIEELRMVRCSFACNACRAEHGIPVGTLGTRRVEIG